MSGKNVWGARAGGWLVAVFLSLGCLAQDSPDERGFRFMTTFGPEDYDAPSQNWSLVETADGLLYVGNLSGLLEYDGESWRRIPMERGSAVLAVAADTEGRIALGGHDEMGYLAPDPTGTLEFVPLTSRVESLVETVGAVLAIRQGPEGFLFVTTDHLVWWRPHDDHLQVDYDAFPIPNPGRFDARLSFQVGDEVLLHSPEGDLYHWLGSALRPLEGGPSVPPDDPLDLILEVPESPDSYLIYSPRQGLRRFHPAEGLRPFAPTISDWLRAMEPTEGTSLDDGRFVISTGRGGILILSAQGEVLEILDSSAGFPDSEVSAIAKGSDGALWAALRLGIVRIPLQARISALDERAGLEGTCLALTRHDGRLFAGTSEGAFVVQPAPVAESRIGFHAERITPMVTQPVFALVSVGGELLVGGGEGVSVWSEGQLHSVDGFDGTRVYSLEPSPFTPNLVFVGLREGLGFLIRGPDGWEFSGIRPGPSLVRFFATLQPTELWTASVFEGVSRWRLATHPNEKFPTLELIDSYHLDSVDPSLNRLSNDLVVAAEDRLYRWDSSQDHFVDWAEITESLDGERFYTLTEDDRQDIWFSTVPPRRIPRDSTGVAIAGPDEGLEELPGFDFPVLLAEPGGILWVGNERGLFRYAAASDGRSRSLRPAKIRRLTSDGRLLYGGGPNHALHPPALPANPKRLRFEFSAGQFGVPSTYQYRLDPMDDSWSEWRSDAFVEFTNLPAGSHTFRVRATSAGRPVSPEATFAFTVDSPWYGSPWAWIAFSGFAWFLLALVARLRHRSLRRRARELESQVADQTRELAANVERLEEAHATVEEKNRLLAEANARLWRQSHRDGLTGIANRRQLEETLHTEWSRAQRNHLPLGLVLVDIDHFKKLNDTAGHHQGDDALKAVAKFLEDGRRRSGDLVARYGGEEFLFVLPATDLQGTSHYAESIRQGIETLDLPHPGVEGGRLTVSLGVASVVPHPRTTPADLVKAADEALYRAKEGGRNRVEIADLPG